MLGNTGHQAIHTEAQETWQLTQNSLWSLPHVARENGSSPVKEASISSDTLPLAVPRLSTMICSHFSQGSESRLTLQFTFPVQVMILWKDCGSVIEPSTTRTVHALRSLVMQLRSSNHILAVYLGTKTLQEEEPATCTICTLSKGQLQPTTESQWLCDKN